MEISSHELQVSSQLHQALDLHVLQKQMAQVLCTEAAGTPR